MLIDARLCRLIHKYLLPLKKKITWYIIKSLNIKNFVKNKFKTE